MSKCNASVDEAEAKAKQYSQEVVSEDTREMLRSRHTLLVGPSMPAIKPIYPSLPLEKSQGGEERLPTRAAEELSNQDVNNRKMARTTERSPCLEVAPVLPASLLSDPAQDEPHHQISIEARMPLPSVNEGCHNAVVNNVIEAGLAPLLPRLELSIPSVSAPPANPIIDAG